MNQTKTLPQCHLCEKQAVDKLDFEAGNNAEFPVTIRLCEEHLKEEEETGYAFQQKYGSKIDDLAYERLIQE